MLFSKPVSPATATNLANYALSPLVLPLAATLAGPDTVLLTVPALTLGTDYTLTVNGIQDLAATPNGLAADSRTAFVASTFIPGGVGLASNPGSAVSAGNGYDITGPGNGIQLNGTSDQFQFNYLPQSGNFDVSVRVKGLTDPNPFAEAGLVARPSLGSNDVFAAVLATPSLANCFFASRTAVGAAATTAGNLPVNYPDTWLRLQRVGTQVTGYGSYDGVTWTQLGAATLPSGPLLVGLAVAGAGATPAVAQFRDYGATASTLTGSVTRPFEPMGPSSRNSMIAFSEIMYKPVKRDDGRNLEYLEIYNSNPWYEDISGYRIAGSVQYAFPPAQSSRAAPIWWWPRRRRTWPRYTASPMWSDPTPAR